MVNDPLPLRTWTRKVDCRAGRRAALRDAIAELPLGVTWDLVIRHQDDCWSLEDWSEGELHFCRCTTLILDARAVSKVDEEAA